MNVKKEMQHESNQNIKEGIWEIIESYFEGRHLERLVSHQIESYNNFVSFQILRTIEMFNPVSIVCEQDLDPISKKYSLEIAINFENFQIYRPQIHENNGSIKLMFPQEARLRNFTYASAMTIDLNIKYIIRNGENLENVQIIQKLLPNIHIGKLPIMLKSNICVLNQYKHVDSSHTGECKYDAGGYFIINGSEKTVLGQERAAENKIYCYNIHKNNPKYTWMAEIKSIPDTKCISPKQINMMILSKNNGFGYPIVLQLPRVKQPLPLFVVFRALGVLSDKEICEKILLNIDFALYKDMLESLQASIIDANNFLTQEEAIQMIQTYVIYTPINMDKETGIKKKYKFTLDILSNDLFPHCNSTDKKIYFMGYMTLRLLQVNFEWIKGDDRDSYINKRVDTTGVLLNNLFRNYFNKLVKDMEKQIIREMINGSWKSTDDYGNIINLTNIYKIIKSTTIENGLKRALATGDFGIKHINNNKVGVAQVLNRLTYMSNLSHLRRIATPTDKSGKLIPPRKLHNTSWGFVCPAETPEGQSVGIVKNLSYLSHLTIYSNSISLYEYVESYIQDIDKLKAIDLFDKVKVMINGNWIGITETPIELYNSLKKKKHDGIINIYTSIIFDIKYKEIRICNDSGRITRPLLKINNKNILLTTEIIEKIKSKDLTWEDLLVNLKIPESVIEYIDPEEQNYSMIATKITDINTPEYKYNFCEIHPSTIFGILASCIPFPEHNQSPRNTYQCAMGKQAMGVYVSNYMERMDKTAYVLINPTRPLVDTRLMNIIKLNEIPSGCNIIVAIMTHTGYNQEDSLLLNKGSIDRGMFMVNLYHTEKDEDKQKINGDEEIRCKPDSSKTKGMKFGNYNKVNSKGIVPENTLIENRDIIMSKVMPIKENRNDPTKVIKFEDQSRIYRTNEEVYIDKNYIERNGDGYSFAKIRLRTLRKPVIGDKFSSRHGQKGTVGNIIPEKDMPFTRDGIRPDIIINPHAIPSRMTVGQLKETLLGKVLIQLGLFGDGTSFGEMDVKYISEQLLKVGYEKNGNELMYNGLTGEQLDCEIFMGPVNYQRLKHMVNDKQHSRSIGPMVNLTRQPAEGRSRDGGLRFGEMERDCEYENTKISLSNGLSVSIKDMEDCDNEVLGWNEKTNNIVPAKQIGFLYKGEKDCIQLTLEDGRTKICTPEHPLLNSHNEWVKAKDFKINEDKVKSSVRCPSVDYKEEIKECNGWELQVGKILFKTDTKENYLKSIIFAKILGYIITDGNIYVNKLNSNNVSCTVFLGHMIDVRSFVKDLMKLWPIKQTKFKSKNLFVINIPAAFSKELIKLPGILCNKRSCQMACLPDFILDPSCPKPIVREFLGGLFGGDGHTCILGKHRGKRDILTSVSFSQTKQEPHLESLTKMMEDMKILFQRFDIHKITIQKLKETTHSKKHQKVKSYQLTLHLDIDELIPFAEKIGFRYCCHKSQRLDAAVSYKELRNHVVRQHNWIVKRVDEITSFSQIKKENPSKIVATKKAISQAVDELKVLEPLIHSYAIPSTHDITDHLIKGTQFGKFTSKSFPNAEEYLKEIEALEWFLNDETIQKEKKERMEEEEMEKEEAKIEEVEQISYGVKRIDEGIPTMSLKVIDIRPVGLHKVYDIEVEHINNFLANGVVAHNCMISHGASRFTQDRIYYSSDKYQVHSCNKCGMIASYNDELHIHLCKTCDNRTDFSLLNIPYSCKLLFQELITMNIAPRFITNHL